MAILGDPKLGVWLNPKGLVEPTGHVRSAESDALCESSRQDYIAVA